MSNHPLIARSIEHLHALCVELDSRRVGSAGNLAATRYAAETLRSLSFRVETPTFACIDWSDHGANVSAGGEGFDASPSPYSLGCRVEAPLVCATTLGEQQAADAGGQILLLQGDLAREPLMPKNFTFYNPDEHRHLIRTLEDLRPAVIISAAARNPEMVGAVYPYPMFEDGDFDLPSVFMTEADGLLLA